MLEGFYSTLSGMLVQQRTLNVLANNITNIKTPGFKAERVVTTSFHEELMVRKENGVKTPIGTSDPIHMVEDVITDIEASSLESSDRPFDMAIVGYGFFNIESEDRQFLTRNGNFDMDEEGYLVLAGAGRVVGQEGPIKVNTSDFYVSEDGTIYDSNDTVIDRLKITQLPDEEGAQMEKFANGLYVAPENAVDVDAEDYHIVQNALEAANFDLNREYTQVMSAQRAFQACSQALKMIDTLNQKTATQIGNI